MDVRAMGQPAGFYTLALKQQARRVAERDLLCPACGRQNAPGRSDIDIDEYDDARCPCGNVFAVYVRGV